MSRFQGRNILVIGASAGIGQATARRLADEGATIVGVARNADRLAAAVATLPGSGHKALAADAASWEQLQPVLQIGRQLGGLAGCVVCAGLHEVRPLAVLDTAGLMRSLEANVAPAMLAAKAFAKAVRPEGGAVVWLSSVAALRGTAAFGAYAAAKGALISAARVAAVELAPRRIRVNVVAAGVVRTAMSEGWLKLLQAPQVEAVEKDHLLGVGQPEDVAGVIAFLLSDDARWITGSVVTADGGLSAH